MQGGELPKREAGNNILPPKDSKDPGDGSGSKKLPTLYQRYLEANPPQPPKAISTKKPDRERVAGSDENARKQAEVQFYLRHGRKPEPGEELG